MREIYFIERSSSACGETASFIRRLGRIYPPKQSSDNEGTKIAVYNEVTNDNLT